MGGSRWDAEDWKRRSAPIRDDRKAGAAPTEAFKSRSIDPDFDPKNIKFRESCDSAANPNSFPIWLAFDVTGSMGKMPHYFVSDGLGILIEQIVKLDVVGDPHIGAMAIGDVACSPPDRAPLQVSQMEADTQLLTQLLKFWIESGGGGNKSESYHLAWYFAANRVKADRMIKGRGKGVLVTIGDEDPPPALTAEQLTLVFGPGEYPAKIQLTDLLAQVQQNWTVFHVCVTKGRNYTSETLPAWQALLPQGHVLVLDDHTKLAELVIAAIAAHAGQDVDALVSKAGWDGSTAVSVRKGISGIKAGAGSGASSKSSKDGLVELAGI